MKIITPENIEIKYYLAGIPTRSAAFLFDVLVQFFLIVGLSLTISATLDVYFLRSLGISKAILTAGIFIIAWGYHVLFEVFFDGKTPGKKYFGLKVVTTEGQKIEFFPSLIRNILRVVDFLPFCFFSGIITMMLTNHHQRIGDFVSKTIVIKDKNNEEKMPAAMEFPQNFHNTTKLKNAVNLHGRKRF